MSLFSFRYIIVSDRVQGLYSPVYTIYPDAFKCNNAVCLRNPPPDVGLARTEPGLGTNREQVNSKHFTCKMSTSATTVYLMLLLVVRQWGQSLSRERPMSARRAWWNSKNHRCVFKCIKQNERTGLEQRLTTVQNKKSDYRWTKITTVKQDGAENLAGSSRNLIAFWVIGLHRC